MGACLAIELTPAGLYLPALDLHLDPRLDPLPRHAECARAFVSHAHADHARLAHDEDHKEEHSGGEVIASPETMALLEARRRGREPGALRSGRVLSWDGAIELPIAREHGGGTARLSIAPAGHVLGAAQLVVDHPGGRLVYTGDYRTGGGATHAPGAPVACDDLVIESTFALPIFLFPDRARVRAELVAWCRARLDAGELPVVLAYALGKAQEIIAELVAAGLPVVAHGAVFAMCEAYEALGVSMGIAEGRVVPYSAAAKGRAAGVLVAPPRAAAQMIKRRANARLAYVSGWALLDAPIERHRADAGFVLSDHADHADLMRTVAATGARRVVTTHGDAEVFARILSARGVAARAITSAPIDQGLDEVADKEGAAS